MKDLTSRYSRLGIEHTNGASAVFGLAAIIIIAALSII